MGACASVPKAMRGEDGGAPPPEPPKEETTTNTEVAEVKAADKEVTVEGEEKKAEGGDDGKSQDGDRQSLGSLLNKTEEEKAAPKTETAAEEQKSEVLPVSDKAAGEPAESTAAAAYVAPVAHPTVEEKEPEVVKEEKK